jgi:phospholipid-binding lipoprotein MlaA
VRLGRQLSTALALLLAAAAAGCAVQPAGLPQPSHLVADPGAAAEAEATPDPFEDFNRKVFAGNQAFNSAVVYPIADAYRTGVPEPVRDRIDAFTTNLSEPMVLANTLLQLRLDAAATTTARFVTNSTVGGLGLFDVAADLGQPHQSGDFGQTLYVWGVRDTAYLVLPVLGPSTVRDGIGTGVGLLAPFGVAAVVPARLAVTANEVGTVDSVGRPVADLGKVGALQEMEASSVDFYAMLRSVSDQKRQSELREAIAQSLLFPSAPQQAADVQQPPTPAIPEGGWEPVGLGGEPGLRK